MSVHPDVQTHSSKISRALALAVPATRKSSSGFIAIATVMTAELSDPLKDNLSQIIVGEWDEKRSLFFAIVCDNNEMPVEFETEALALGQAIELNDSLGKRYRYGLFASHGVLASVDPDDITHGATLHFFKAGRPR